MHQWRAATRHHVEVDLWVDVTLRDYSDTLKSTPTWLVEAEGAIWLAENNSLHL